MSPDTDRIAVPTNGRKPNPAPVPARTRPSRAAVELDGSHDDDDAVDTSEAALSVAFTPKQLAIGFGILASLVLLAAGAARRRSGR